MRKYQNEQEFVSNFAKDCKESLKNGLNFEAEVNNVKVVLYQVLFVIEIGYSIFLFFQKW